MNPRPLFEGLVVDEYGTPVEVGHVGQEPCYVVYDPWGMAYHIPAAQVDRQVLERLLALVRGHEEVLAREAARFLGQEDPEIVAMLAEQFARLEEHLGSLLQIGLPEDARYLLGLLGFRVVINHHGEVIEMQFPQGTGEFPEEE